MKRLSKASKALAVGALAVAALGVTTSSASASNETNWTNGCRGYWYTTSFHGYCNSVSPSGYFRLVGDCNYETDYYGKWYWLNPGYYGKFDYDECTFKVNWSTVQYNAN